MREAVDGCSGQRRGAVVTAIQPVVLVGGEAFASAATFYDRVTGSGEPARHSTPVVGGGCTPRIGPSRNKSQAAASGNASAGEPAHLLMLLGCKHLGHGAIFDTNASVWPAFVSTAANPVIDVDSNEPTTYTPDDVAAIP